jgi:MoxR-like ATPase
MNSKQKSKPKTGHRKQETGDRKPTTPAVPGHKMLRSGLWIPTSETVQRTLEESHQPKPHDRYTPRDGELSLFNFALKTKRPLMIIGPPGTAKTLFAETMAKLHGLPFVDVPFAKGCTISAQVGSINVFTATDGSVHMVSDDGPVVTAARAPNGAVLYCDEIRKAEGDQLSFYASLTDGRRRITVPETKEHFELNPNLIVLASYNPGVLFSSNELEPAIARRFLTIRFEYLSADESKKRVLAKIKQASGAVLDDEQYWQSLKDRIVQEQEVMEKRSEAIEKSSIIEQIVDELQKAVVQLRDKAERGEITVKELPADSLIDNAVEMILTGFDYSTSLLTAIINPILSDIDPEWKASSQAMLTDLKSQLPSEPEIK